LFSGGLKQGLVQWRTGAGSCSVVDWSRVFFRGGLAQGLFQWPTSTESCSVADWSRFLFSGGLERAFFSGGLLKGVVLWRTGTGSYSVANEHCLVPSCIHCTAMLLCILSLKTGVSSVTAASRLYPKLSGLFGSQNLDRCADDKCRQDSHTDSPLSLFHNVPLCDSAL